MLSNFSKYFNDVAFQCTSFMSTMQSIRFNEEDESPEVFLMTSMNLNINNSKSISLLLDNDQYGAVIMICRNIMESFFNIHWAFEPSEKEAVKERVFQLEGDTYYHMDKEIKLYELDQKSSEPMWSKQNYETLKKMIENEKNNFPQLLTKDKKGNDVFKHPPRFSERMAEQRLKYYQIYIFTSLFTHPSPKLKEFYLRRVVIDKSNFEIIEDALKQTLVYSLYLIQSIVGYTKIVFDDINQNEKVIREICLNEIKSIVKEASKGIVDFGENAN